MEILARQDIGELCEDLRAVALGDRMGQGRSLSEEESSQACVPFSRHPAATSWVRFEPCPAPQQGRIWALGGKAWAPRGIPGGCCELGAGRIKRYLARGRVAQPMSRPDLDGGKNSC